MKGTIIASITINEVTHVVSIDIDRIFYYRLFVIMMILSSINAGIMAGIGYIFGYRYSDGYNSLPPLESLNILFGFSLICLSFMFLIFEKNKLIKNICWIGSFSIGCFVIAFHLPNLIFTIISRLMK